MQNSSSQPEGLFGITYQMFTVQITTKLQLWSSNKVSFWCGVSTSGSAHRRNCVCWRLQRWEGWDPRLHTPEAFTCRPHTCSIGWHLIPTSPWFSQFQWCHVPSSRLAEFLCQPAQSARARAPFSCVSWLAHHSHLWRADLLQPRVPQPKPRNCGTPRIADSTVPHRLRWAPFRCLPGFPGPVGGGFYWGWLLHEKENHIDERLWQQLMNSKASSSAHS